MARPCDPVVLAPWRLSFHNKVARWRDEVAVLVDVALRGAQGATDDGITMREVRCSKPRGWRVRGERVVAAAMRCALIACAVLFVGAGGGAHRVDGGLEVRRHRDAVGGEDDRELLDLVARDVCRAARHIETELGA